jgi:transglutaminase-like putative cysteine protease
MSVWGRAGRSGTAAGLISICLSLLCSPVFAAESSGNALYRLTSAPGWVKPASVDYGAPLPEGGASGGSWLLMYDLQFNARADGQDQYQHSAVKIISAGGVDEYSQFDLPVDPTYQSLDIHSVKVIREGHVSDQLHSARITALPQETELRNRIYNGGYNINVLLSDVRVGDIVEYDFTRHSRERIFPGQFSARMSIAWSVPVHWQRVRVLSAASRELFYRVSDQQKIPAPAVHGAVREFEWQWHDLPGIAGDEDRPKWHSAWPHLQITSSRDWAEVGRQVASLFAVTEPASREQLAVVDEIRKAGGPPVEQALHALQFVQDQIRYVSISIGRGAFRPSSPNVVLDRRFGDCKDKSLLLVTILRQLGIEAHVALVNSRIGRVLEGALPDPYSFDHAIVRVKIGEQTFWVDGTADKQLSPLSTGSPASYGWALVVGEPASSLANIPRPAPDSAGKKSEVLIDMSAGMNKPAKLQITTSYLGRWADSQRQDLADDIPQKRQSNYVNYIAGYYPGARTAAPIAIVDDKDHNVIKVSEYYDLPQTFITKNGRQRFFVQVDELYRYADNLKSSVRVSPLAIAYPADVQQTIRVILPEKWPAQDETVKVDNPAFHYISTVTYADKGAFGELTLDYKYRALTDVVELSRLAQYVADRKRVDDDLGYYIRPPAGQSSRVTTFVVKPAVLAKAVVLASVPKWSMLLSLALAIYLAVRYGYRWDPQPKPARSDWPSGIRGWLIVFAVIAVISPIAWIAILYVKATSFSVERWSGLPELVPAPLKTVVQPTLLLLAAVGILLLVAFVLTAILFFRRRSSAPQMFIAVHWAGVCWSLAMQVYLSACQLAAHTDFGDRLWAGRFDLICVIAYTAYFELSKRVKTTFVKRFPADRSRGVIASPALR